MHETAGDSDLFARYARGDAKAFDALYARHRVPLFSFLVRQSGRQKREVEEVFQETWLKVIDNAARFDASKPFAPWLYRIARNCLVDRWRHLGAVESIHVSNDIAMAGAASDGLHQPERLAGSDMLRERWQRALATLPAVQREALLLKLEGGFSLDDIAIITGAGRETVKTRLRYATARMRALLDEVQHELA